MASTTPPYSVQAVPVTGSGMAVSPAGPGDHAACDAEIARLRERCAERDRLISALIAEHPVELGRFAKLLRDAAEGALTMADPREPLGRIVHEQRLAFNAERDKPFGLVPWGERHESQRELDMRIGSAVAAQAVHDAGLEAERMKAQLFAFGAHLPAIRRALTIAATVAEYEHDAKQYRAVLQALGIGSDEKETPR